MKPKLKFIPNPRGSTATFNPVPNGLHGSYNIIKRGDGTYAVWITISPSRKAPKDVVNEKATELFSTLLEAEQWAQTHYVSVLRERYNLGAYI